MVSVPESGFWAEVVGPPVFAGAGWPPQAASQPALARPVTPSRAARSVTRRVVRPAGAAGVVLVAPIRTVLSPGAIASMCAPSYCARTGDLNPNFIFAPRGRGDITRIVGNRGS